MTILPPSFGICLYPAAYITARAVLQCIDIKEDGPNKKGLEERGRMAQTFMQALHSVVGPLMGALAIWQLTRMDESSDNNNQNYIEHKNVLLTHNAFWEAGYYSFDLFMSIRKTLCTSKWWKTYGLVDFGFDLHHAIPLMAARAYFVWREARVTRATDLVTACVYLSNIQMLFRHLMQVTKKVYGLPDTHPYNRAAVASFFLSSLTFRFGGLLWLLSIFPSMMGHNDHKDNSVMDGWQLMPRHCQLATGTLMFVNAVYLVITFKERAIPAIAGGSSKPIKQI